MKKKILYFTGGIVSALLVFILVTQIVSFLKPDKDKDNEGLVEEEFTFDLDMIPTYEELGEMMNTRLEEIYGMDYEALVTKNADLIKIPGTKITFPTTEVGDAVDLMAVTAMALQRNPYAMKPEEDTIRELPDGTQLVMATLVENYTGLRKYESSVDPSTVKYTGYVNGKAFEEDVDLVDWYVRFEQLKE